MSKENIPFVVGIKLKRKLKDLICSWQFLLPIIILLFCLPLVIGLWHVDKTITDENRLVENAQVVFLALAVFFHVFYGSRINSKGVARVYHLVLAHLCFSMIVREVDINKLGASFFWDNIELAVRVCVGFIWLVLTVYIFRNWKKLWNQKKVLLLSKGSLLVGAGIFLYMVSAPFDKSFFLLTASVSQLWEELLQLSGTLFLFSAALRKIDLID